MYSVPPMLWWRQENIYQCHIFLHKKRHKKKRLHLWNKALSSRVHRYRMYFMLCAHHLPSLFAVISKRCNNKFFSCLEEQKSGPHGTLLQHALNSHRGGSSYFYCESSVSIPLFFIITCVHNRRPNGPLIPSIIHIMRKQACPVTERSGFNNSTVAIILS